MHTSKHAHACLQRLTVGKCLRMVFESRSNGIDMLFNVMERGF